MEVDSTGVRCPTHPWQDHAFTRRAEAGGAGLGTTAISRQLSLKTLLSPYVHDAPVNYAGGGVSVAQIRKGAGYVAELQREMDRTRRERLQSLGFEPAAASQMSAYHTKNFM